MHYRAIVLGLMLAVSGAATALAADIYTWTDAEGLVHFGDIPGGEHPVRLDINSRPTDPARVQAITHALAQQRIKVAESKAAAALEGPSAQELRAEADDRARKCSAYKANLETFLINRRLYNEGPDGEREYLSDAEITAARELTAKQVTEFCSPI